MLVALYVTENTEPTERRTTLTVTSEAGETAQIAVIQKGQADRFIITSKNSLAFSSQGGESTVVLSASHRWTVSSDSGWCAVSAAEGVNPKGNNLTLLVTAEEYTGFTARETSVTVALETGETAEIVVTQEGKSDVTPRLLSFGFKASGNPLLASNVVCSIEENTIFMIVPHVEVPHLLQKKWVPHFTFEGSAVFIGDKIQESGNDSVDFSSPVEYTVQNQTGQSKTYTVKVLSHTGIPIVAINTQDNAPILSKDEYVTGDVRILGDMTTAIFSGTMKIKGRGNATWTNYPKKPYRIKLDKKAEILGMPSDKDWVLLAEYTDKSLLRHTYAFELSKLAGLPWTPRCRHVELFKNGVYQGTYLLGEHVKVAKDRVNAADDGFLIGNDKNYADEPLWFTTTIRSFHYTFKHPDTDDITINDANYTYIQNLMNEFEAALYAENFLDDPENGYRKYIDMKSFVLWYLVQETLGNFDTNPFFVLESRSGKLKLYPVWDLEWSLGLATVTWDNPPAVSPVEHFYWRNNMMYYDQLFNDPYFVSLVKEQWSHMKSEWLPALEKKIDEEKELIRYAQKENFERWQLLGKYIGVGLTNFSTWEEETIYAKTFLKQRVAWLDAQINSW
jgi:hypothetical protein